MEAEAGGAGWLPASSLAGGEGPVGERQEEGELYLWVARVGLRGPEVARRRGAGPAADGGQRWRSSGGHGRWWPGLGGPVSRRGPVPGGGSGRGRAEDGVHRGGAAAMAGTGGGARVPARAVAGAAEWRLGEMEWKATNVSGWS